MKSLPPLIEMAEKGFVVKKDGDIFFRIEWAKVQEIVAYKEDHFTVDAICIGFRVDDAEHYWRVTEDFIGYKELRAELEKRFLDIHSNWFAKVAFPAFKENWTILWGKAPKQS